MNRGNKINVFVFLDWNWKKNINQIILKKLYKQTIEMITLQIMRKKDWYVYHWNDISWCYHFSIHSMHSDDDDEYIKRNNTYRFRLQPYHYLLDWHFLFVLQQLLILSTLMMMMFALNEYMSYFFSIHQHLNHSL